MSTLETFAFGVFAISILIAAVAGLVSHTTRKRAHSAVVLCCIRGADIGLTVALDASPLLIGRIPDCAVLLGDGNVSRFHASVVGEADGAHVTDAGSTNGIWMDGRKIFSERLSVDDQFQIGESVFVVLRNAQRWPQPRDHMPARSPVQPRCDLSAYELLEVLHSGSTFVTRRACARVDGEQVAIKFLNRRPEREDMRAQFGRYLTQSRRLTHPLWVSVLGGDETADPPFVIEPLVLGGSLRQRARGMLRDDAFRALADIAEALAWLHAQGLAHGGLTAGDVLFGSDNRVRVANAGLVRALTDQACDSASDMRALGMLAFQLLGGEAPQLLPPRHAAARPTLQRGLELLAPELPRALIATVHALMLDAGRVQPTQVDAARFAASMRALTGGVTLTNADRMQPAQTRPIRLHVLTTGEIIAVTANPFALGRDLLNPADREMSRAHAHLTYHDNAWWIEPIAEARTNGVSIGHTLVVEPRVIAVGDDLRLGATAIRIVE